jgi:NAD(P)-dependent dehydrogenase (short-subunit alcohol dehydrogenase family)
MTKGLGGDVALVTGAGSGVGRAVARLLGNGGADVILADADRGTLDQTAETLGPSAGGALKFEIDMAEEAAVNSMLDAAVETFDHVNHVVNNVVIDEDVVRSAGTHPEVFRRTLDVTLHGVATCLRRSIPIVVSARGGTVINVISLLESDDVDAGGPVLAAKHGVMGLTKTAAIDYAEEDVRITALCPGFVETPLLDETDLDDPEARARVEALDPVDRFGHVEEVAAGVAWLCSLKRSNHWSPDRPPGQLSVAR